MGRVSLFSYWIHLPKLVFPSFPYPSDQKIRSIEVSDSKNFVYDERLTFPFANFFNAFLDNAVSLPCPLLDWSGMTTT